MLSLVLLTKAVVDGAPGYQIIAVSCVHIVEST